MKMQRLPDWPLRLKLLLAERVSQPFVWGGQDCCLFPCDGVLAITGTDPAHFFRGRYSTRKTALQALAEFLDYDGTGMGLSRLLEATARKIGTQLDAPLIPVLMAQRGDVVFATHKAGASLGLAVDHRAVFAGHKGLIHRPLATCQLAWRV